ncbi:DUF262 domain-containing protein [Salinarimonas ramus]|uniref:GmrSD restriction endonucleases N-terminal domain-containing protein n=1 Tax=Salinarimonas ramus TaxID=690164 RepID=A0A917Q7N6_9HYPH|nr:DUF262 domain-containing protein [Salinarimonas ramus]GGK28365.1 hypothetical protein GCM10011322_13560 [Salinarimonas ramus]
MSYQSSTVARVVDQVNRTYFLPAIQRPYVWQPDQIVALFDSLLKGFPISSFLFWDIDPQRRSDWEIYRFVEHYRVGETENTPVEPDGREVVLVLDGQQRLTSLLLGLRGTLSVRPKYKRRHDPDSWSRQRLYIDLLQDPDAEDEEEDGGERGVTYGLRFAEVEPPSGGGRLWMKVGRILDCVGDDAYDRLREEILDRLPQTATRADERLVGRTFDRLYRAIWKDEVVAYYTEKHQSYDRVVEIFIRANDGGLKLAKSDLLMSMITAKWGGASARQEIFELVEHLNRGLSAKNDIDKDFVLKSCLVLCDLDQRYRAGNFNAANLARIEKDWTRIKVSLEATLRLVNCFGIDAHTLTSVNALLPIAYWLHKADAGGLDGSTPFETRNAGKIHRWLVGSLLNGVFGGNSDSTIGRARAILQAERGPDADFPVRPLVRGLASRGRVAGFDEAAIDALLDATYGRRTCFLALSLLYDAHAWGVTPHHVDHIIPRALANRKALMAKNLSETEIVRILEAVDRVGNLQILPARENLEKSDLPFSTWIQTRDEAFLERHLIPADSNLWDVRALPDFVRARERLVRARVRALDLSVTDAGLAVAYPEGFRGNA